MERNAGNQAAIFWRNLYPDHLVGDTGNSNMFPCCIPTSQGSGLRKAQSWSPFLWGQVSPQILWPFSWRKAKVTKGGPGYARPPCQFHQPLPVCACVCGVHVGRACPHRSRLRRAQKPEGRLCTHPRLRLAGWGLEGGAAWPQVYPKPSVEFHVTGVEVSTHTSLCLMWELKVKWAEDGNGGRAGL